MSALASFGAIAAASAGCSTALYPLLSWLVHHSEGRRAAQVKAAISAAVTGAMGEVKTEVARSVEESRANGDRLTKIEAQFGRNGGGLREKVDRIGADVEAVKVRQEGVASSHEGFVERFQDHLRQASDDRARLAGVEQALMQKGAT